MCEYDTSTSVRQWLYSAPKFLCLMTSILLFLLVIKLSTRDSLFYNEQAVVFSNIYANFRKQPINDIALAQDSECPSGYEKVSLGVWAGTNEGCAFDDHLIYSGSCPKGSSSDRKIPAIEPLTIELWNNNIFCIKRTVNLPTNDIRACESSCSDDTCISSLETCPIISINIIGRDESILNHSEIVLNDYTKLVYSTNSTINGSIDFITDLNVTLFGEPCLDPSKNPLPKDEPINPLLTGFGVGCGEFGPTNHFKILGTLPANELLKQNGIDDSQLNPILKKDLENTMAYFSAIKRYTVANASKCTTSPEVFKRLKIQEATFMDSLWAITIVLLLVVVALLVTLPIETFLRYRNKDEEKLMLRLMAYLNIGLLSFLFFLYIVKGIIALDAQSDLNPEVGYLKNILLNECFKQAEVNQALEKLIHHITNDIYVIIALNITLLCISLIGLILISVLTGVDISQVRRFKESQISSGIRSRRKKNNQNNRNGGNTEMLLRNAH